MNIIFE